MVPPAQPGQTQRETHPSLRPKGQQMAAASAYEGIGEGKGRLALAGLKTGIAAIDDIDAAAPTDNAAVLVPPFDRL